MTPDGITVKPLYTAADLAACRTPTRCPAFEPFMRGPQATDVRGAAWTIRQYAGFSTAEDSNAFYRKALAAGGRARRWPSTWPRTAATTATTRA